MAESNVDYSPVVPEKTTRASDLRQKLLDKVPEANRPETASDMEHLLIAQLAENLSLNDAQRFIDRLPDGTPAYGLPCEFRVIKGQYQALIPRMANWHFIRPLPARANHPPFTETYGFIRKSHSFQKRAEELMGIDDLVDYCQNSKNDPPLIGEGAGQTPYHRLYWTGEQLIIELQNQPTAGQALSLNDLKERFSKFIPTTVMVKDKQKSQPLPKSEEVLARLKTSVTVDTDYNHLLTYAHTAAISPEGNLTLDYRPPAANPNIIIGFGYFYTQLEAGRREATEGSLHDLTIHLGFQARNHEEAKGSFALQRLASKVIGKRIEEEQIGYSKLGITTDEQAKALEDQLASTQTEEFEQTDLGQKWPLRREILEDYLPFRLNIQGLQVPCGYRAEINQETQCVTLELLVARDSLDLPAKKALLEKIVQQQAGELADRLAYVPDKQGKYLQINRFQGKIVEVKTTDDEPRPTTG